MERDFSFIQSSFAARSGELVYWVFQKSKFLPIAFIEETPGIMEVFIFRGDKNMLDSIKKAFEEFSGCS